MPALVSSGSVGYRPSTPLRELCSNLVRHLKNLGYPHADASTCERMIRAYFSYTPDLTEGSADLEEAASFLERFMRECRQREQETTPLNRARRCYGQAVEQAVTEAESHGELSGIAPRLTELMTQLDADGHNTTQLRLELESLIDELGMHHFYK